MLREPCLRNDIHIDLLYLDNTNCDPTRVLPTRERALEKIKEIIRSHPDHNVVIGKCCRSRMERDLGENETSFCWETNGDSIGEYNIFSSRTNNNTNPA